MRASCRTTPRRAAPLLSSHLMGEVAETADDLVVIDRGRIVTRGTVAEVTAGHSSLEEAFFALTGTAATPGGGA